MSTCTWRCHLRNSLRNCEGRLCHPRVLRWDTEDFCGRCAMSPKRPLAVQKSMPNFKIWNYRRRCSVKQNTWAAWLMESQAALSILDQRGIVAILCPESRPCLTHTHTHGQVIGWRDLTGDILFGTQVPAQMSSHWMSQLVIKRVAEWLCSPIKLSVKLPWNSRYSLTM